MPFARFTVHHNFEVERQFAGREKRIPVLVEMNTLSKHNNQNYIAILQIFIYQNLSLIYLTGIIVIKQYTTFIKNGLVYCHDICFSIPNV
jgi:hypothetical protein